MTSTVPSVEPPSMTSSSTAGWSGAVTLANARSIVFAALKTNMTTVIVGSVPVTGEFKPTRLAPAGRSIDQDFFALRVAAGDKGHSACHVRHEQREPIRLRAVRIRAVHGMAVKES